MGRRSNQVKGNKKELYTGDPNAKMTMCAKKLRRHHAIDLEPQVMIDEKFKSKDNPNGAKLYFICRYCKEIPTKHNAEE